MKRASRRLISASCRCSLRRAVLSLWASPRAICCPAPSRRSQLRSLRIARFRQSKSGRRKCSERQRARGQLPVARCQGLRYTPANMACSRRLLRDNQRPVHRCRRQRVRACRSFTSRADYRRCRSQCPERWPIGWPQPRRKSASCSAWLNCVRKQLPGNTAPRAAPRTNRPRLFPRPRTLLYRRQCLSRGSRRRHDQLIPHRLDRRL